MRIEFSGKIMLKFLVTVTLVMVIGVSIHGVISKEIGSSSLITIFVSYFSQWLLSIGSFFLIARVSQRKGEQAGFYFLGLSMLKFLVYVVGFRLYFIQDGEVSREEYAIFFIPYIAAFVVEIIYLVYVLNNTPIDPENVISYSDEEE